MLTLFPVILLSIAQSVVALILLAPLPIAQGGISLCKASRTPVGRTFLASLSVFLLVLLVPPVLEVQTLRSQAKWQQSSGKDYSELEALHRRDAEALAALSAVLTIYCLLMCFVLQKLGTTMSERELAKLKEATLLKQVKGLHTEYDRLSSQQTGATSAPDGSQQLHATLAAAQSRIQELEANLKEADRKRKAAELNQDALKTQAAGLENEYDRLLAELEKHQQPQRVTRRFTFGPSEKKDT